MTGNIAPPVIAPTLSYPAIKADVGSTVLPGHDGLRVELQGAALPHRDLMAMTAGILTFEPGTSGIARLALKIAPNAVHRIRDRTAQGLPALQTIVYEGVDPGEVRLALGALLTAAGLNEQLRLWMSAGNASTPPDPHAAALQILMRDVPLPMGLSPSTAVAQGARIGAAALASPQRAAFTLRTTDAGGNAITPAPYIKSLDKIDGGTRYAAHPLITEMTGVTPQPSELFLKFQIYDVAGMAHVDLSNAPVSVKEVGLVFDDTLQTANTGQDGSVSFTFAAADTLEGRDFYFEVDLSQLSSFAGHSDLPDNWSTDGWRSADDTLDGRQSNFQGFRLGANGAPAIFHVGVDFHVEVVRYDNDSDFQGKVSPVPVFAGTGIYVGIKHVDGTRILPSTRRPLSNGRVHGVVFDIAPGEDFDMVFPYLVDVRKLYALSCDTIGEIGTWRTSTLSHANITRTSFGAAGKPLRIDPPTAQYNGALHELKTLLELVTFLDAITGGLSTPMRRSPLGVDQPILITHDIVDSLNSQAGLTVQPFSWPQGYIHLKSASLPNASTISGQRRTMFHESMHQVTYFDGGLSELLIGPTALLISEIGNISIEMENRVRDAVGMDALPPFNFGNHLFHGMDYLTNPRSTLVEAYPEAIAKILSYDWGAPQAEPPPPVSLTRLSFLGVRKGGKFKPSRTEVLGPVFPNEAETGPPGRGINVEGAVVNALFQIFVYEVIDPVAPLTTITPPMLRSTPDGNVTAPGIAAHAWIGDTRIRDRFRRMIWNPMSDLSGVQGPVSMSTLLDNMMAANPTDWHRMLRWLNCWNIRMFAPKVSATASVSVSNVVTRVTVSGSNFVEGQTTVTLIDRSTGAAVSLRSTTVTSATEIDIDIATPAAGSTFELTCATTQQLPPPEPLGARKFEIGRDIAPLTIP